MDRSRISFRAGIVLTASSWIGLAGCSSMGTQVAGTKSPDNSSGALASLLGKRQTGGPARPAPGSSAPGSLANASASAASERNVPLNDTTRTNVSLAMGEMLEAGDNLPAAAEHYERAVKLDPKSLRASLSLARVYNRMGRPDAALKLYESAEKQHRKEPSLYNDKGLMLAEQKDWTGAVAALRTASKLDPSNSKYHNNLGMVLAASGEYDEAWQEFREAIGAGPAHYNIAKMLLQAGHTEVAREHLNQALAIMPSLQEARMVLAQLGEPATPRDTVAGQAELQFVELIEAPAKSTLAIEPLPSDDGIESPMPDEAIVPDAIVPESPDDALAPRSGTVPAHHNPWAKPRGALNRRR